MKKALNKIGIFMLGAGCLGLPGAAHANETVNTLFAPSSSDKKDPSTFVADAVSYDDKTDIVTASGRVEIANSQHVLLADQVVYDKKTNQLAAKGHVVLYQASGQVIFGDKMQLTSDMRDGFMTAVGVLMPDNTRLTAPVGERFSGRWLRLYNGTYSPYTPDPADPLAPPLWQLDAKQIVHDETAQEIIYHDAWLDLDGQPVLYTPYMSAPDPTVKRRSGFLTPTLGFGSVLGTNLRTPYYYDIAPETDMVVTPWFSEHDGLQADAILRHRFTNGNITAEASAVDTNNTSNTDATQHGLYPGHLTSTGILDYSDGWRVGENLQLTDTNSYLVRYSYSAAPTLINRLYAENFSGRDYFVANSYYFQNTIPLTPQQPLAVPELEYSAIGQPGSTFGGRWSFQSGLLDLLHDGTTGTDVDRGSLAGGWERKTYSSLGIVGTFDANLRDDIYFTRNLVDANAPDGATPDEVTANRLFPSGQAMVSYPFARRFATVQQTLEPVASLYAAPVPRNEYLIPNIDSQDFELDATNIFNPNGFSGIDREEGGTRATYGVKTGFYGDGGGSTSFFLGESYAFQTDPNIPVDSGFNGHRSDVVGQVQVNPSNLLMADYNFRLDSDTLVPDMHEVDILAGDRKLRATVDYLYIENSDQTDGIDNGFRQQVSYGINSEITDMWTVATAQTVDLTGEGVLATSLRLIYADEGLTVSLTANVNNTDRAGTIHGTAVLLQVALKGLGGQTLQPFSIGTFGSAHQTPY